ncbi:MAG: hypothetical protein ACRD3J_24215 [Thermoanaerobaculia bacterium]
MSGEITVVMNHFNQHPAMLDWQPTVHCVAEPATRYESPEGVRYLQGMLRGYTTTTHVFPIETKALFDRTAFLAPERLVLVKQDGRTAADFDHIDLTGPIPSLHDTSILAVSVAVAMGCNPIVLIGLDYDWLCHDSIRRHFYDDAEVPWEPEDLTKVPYLAEMRTAIPRWEAHAQLSLIAARTGQVIVNATKGSFLDVYPIVPIGTVLPGAASPRTGRE